jgi:hypothetical protein
MSGIDSFSRDIFSFIQHAQKGTIGKNDLFLCHNNGKSYIITAEKEKKHTFLRFLNKTKVDIYEAGGNVKDKDQISSPDHAVDAGLLDHGPLFNTVSLIGAKKLMSYETKNSIFGKFSQSKLRSAMQRNIPALASETPKSIPSSPSTPQTPGGAHSVKYESLKSSDTSREAPPGNESIPEAVTPPHTEAQTPQPVESRRGTLDEIKSSAEASGQKVIDRMKQTPRIPPTEPQQPA